MARERLGDHVTGFDPLLWAARQRAIDAARISDPSLVAHKRDKMAASPLAFLRGAAPLFYELLAAYPELGAGPDAIGWMVGDLHVENFGAYRPSALTFADERHEDARRAVFDVNDFDDATIGPVHLDVLRLCTSLLLATRDLGVGGTARAALGAALLEAHAAALSGSVMQPPEAPPCVRDLLDAVRRRNRKALLDARTSVVGHARRFERGARYRDLSPDLAREVPSAFAAYIASLPVDEQPSDDASIVLDCAARVAGTGSLGNLRVAVLTSGKGGADGAFVFDLKAQGDPSACVLFAGPSLSPVARVRAAAHALLDHPPRMLGETVLAGRPCLGRRLAPQEDRLDWSRLRDHALEPLVRHLGWLVGRAHRRGLRAPLGAPWDASVQRRALGNALCLMGMHEAVFVALAL